ncbi:hypothetical protein LEP1GSC170_4576 [Leptospira interrogans serovar Bataviae str. HAI135]|nr:hypothetical protein LEP1GSC170_4576 [Leptospira interrogans serovar Bataviae str. HAI135]
MIRSFHTKSLLFILFSISIFYFCKGSNNSQQMILKEKHIFRIRVGKPKPHREKYIGFYCPIQIETIDLKKFIPL